MFQCMECEYRQQHADDDGADDACHDEEERDLSVRPGYRFQNCHQGLFFDTVSAIVVWVRAVGVFVISSRRRGRSRRVRVLFQPQEVDAA